MSTMEEKEKQLIALMIESNNLNSEILNFEKELGRSGISQASDEAEK